MAKSILIIPIKKYSERVPGKNFTKIKGIPLYQIIPVKCLQADCFDKIVIDTDSEEIIQWCEDNGIHPLLRRPELASNNANGNALLRHHVSAFPGYDYYWQGFVTAPFIEADTIRDLEHTLRNDRDDLEDSIMTVKVHRSHMWLENGTPLYRPDLLPRSQDLPKVYQEISGFFGITKEAFKLTRARVGEDPIFYELSKEETLDIDWPLDVPK